MGRPGIDFPAFTGIPVTQFSCRGTPGGYYADLETNCQVLGYSKSNGTQFLDIKYNSILFFRFSIYVMVAERSRSCAPMERYSSNRI